MSDDEKKRRNSIPPEWVLLAVTFLMTVIGLSFCFGPVQPPSACLKDSVVTAGSSPNNVGVCPP